ncbi:MAG TPA: alpha/beta hydrolase, partial [Candidatus Tectomicrobia bacterium]|nr:alpha/beta hydrolase [Candidatus Tectomicrobia bacterium]
MSKLAQRTIETNGIRMRVAEQGEGPLVVLCHGFPESWYSWRHQLPALAAAGFHAVAPDMRGYGGTDAPEAIEQYTLFHLVGDMVGLLDALGAPTAAIVGHDWGAPVAWHAALMRPDRFRAVAGLSVPFRPRGPVRPTTVMPQTEDMVFYQLYFQAPGVAEAELERDPRATIRHVVAWASEPTRVAGSVGMVPRRGGLLGGRPAPP